MPQQVVGTAVTNCIFSLGGAPSTFIPTPRPILSSSLINGVIIDNIPFTNIVPFPMCCSPSNPAFIAAGWWAFHSYCCVHSRAVIRITISLRRGPSVLLKRR